ncbi:MAG TPA: DUF3048 domain-containing protein [Candidatus Saccharimonadales bacterium]|nr:DUF3048 domain-containing protein [Candidatus Saccharimonadales bacterium]
MFQDIKPPKRSDSKSVSHKSLANLGGHAINKARQQIHEIPNEVIEAIDLDEKAEKNEKVRFRRLKGWWRHIGENRRFAIVSAALLIFITGAIVYFYFTRPSSQTSIAITKHAKKPPAPTTLASPLTGVQVAPELASRPVTGIMIENSLDARPQSGIEQAGVIFEAIAEGGITRFLTLYQDAQPQYIGPVRSLRPYYIDWATPFDASIAHVGGSPEALAQIRSGGKDLDQFFNSGSYWRQSTRAAPHNVYTSFERMDALNKIKGYTSSHFTSWPRKADKPIAVPTAKSIDVNIASFYFNSHYDYDASTNSYFRFEGGAPHKTITSSSDANAQQLHPKVLIALVMPYSIEADGQHSAYSTYGNGVAYVFEDGGVTQGLWTKANRADQFKFTDASGAPVKLNAGQTWVVPVARADMVVYRP